MTSSITFRGLRFANSLSGRAPPVRHTQKDRVQYEVTCANIWQLEVCDTQLIAHPHR